MGNDKRPIGIFDSGVGGISVLREAIKVLPNEDFIYFGDSKNAPYGTKPTKKVVDLSLQSAERLIALGVKAIVIACNTATAVAADILRQKYPEMPIVGVEPAIKPAVLYKNNSKILVMATEVTLREKKFRELLKKYENCGTFYILPCLGLMEWVERGVFSGEELENFLKGLLAPYRGIEFDSAVLGCTHYPFLKNEIQKVIGGNVKLFDGGVGTARELKRRLLCMDLGNAEQNKGKVEFRNSKEDESEIDLCKTLLKL